MFCTVPACFSSCFSCCGRSKKEETEGLLAIDKIKMENSLSRTLTTNRVRSVRHPVTGVRRVERTRQDSDSDYEARTSRPRPKLKAARVGKTVKREDKHSDSESSTFRYTLHSVVRNKSRHFLLGRGE